MKKMLIAYFSASGVTAHAAKFLAGISGSDCYEIRPKVPYKSSDLNWINPFSRSTREMKGRLAHPEIQRVDLAIEDYDIILLGFPIWWHVAPTIINTFLESYDFSGKTIVLFATSGGSGFGKTVEKLKESVSDDTRIVEGEILNGTLNGEELDNWLKSIRI